MTLDRGWRTVVCAASGPSITAEQCAVVAMAQRDGRCHSIVVNNTWTLLQGASVLYAADGKWWEKYLGAVQARFTGELWTQDHKASTDMGLRWIHSEPGAGIHPDPSKIFGGANSGHQAMCLAHRFGASKIVLIGFDMQRTGGAFHFHGKHPEPLSNGNPSAFVKHFETLAPQLAAAGVRVVNCSRETALTCFERGDLEDALR